MELEEQEGVDSAGGDRCEVCGAPLTEDEQKAALAGGPALCKIHAAEQVSTADDELADQPVAAEDETRFGDPAA